MHKSFSIGVTLILLITLSVACGRAEHAELHEPSRPAAASSETININAATREELQRIPHIGEKLADEIIEYREKHGPFRRAEQLMLLNGISDGRFREIRHLVRVN